MTAFLRSPRTYLIENKTCQQGRSEQVLINKRSRENAEKTRQSIKKPQQCDMANRVRNSSTADQGQTVARSTS
ncbi:MAG: hypothetical protein ACLU1W_05515 [Collinsella sp.]